MRHVHAYTFSCVYYNQMKWLQYQSVNSHAYKWPQCHCTKAASLKINVLNLCGKPASDWTKPYSLPPPLVFSGWVTDAMKIRVDTDEWKHITPSPALLLLIFFFVSVSNPITTTTTNTNKTNKPKLSQMTFDLSWRLVFMRGRRLGNHLQWTADSVFMLLHTVGWIQP